MEKRIQKKTTDFINNQKQELDRVLKSCASLNEEDKIKLENYLNNSPSLIFEKEDFQRRKRVKNSVAMYERCVARRASMERCTRRKKEGQEYCGTHSKGQPHGVISEEENISHNPVKKITLHTQEIKGIIYYVDDHYNVYDSNDIMNGSKTPKIIANYSKLPDGSFFIKQ